MTDSNQYHFNISLLISLGTCLYLAMLVKYWNQDLPYLVFDFGTQIRGGRIGPQQIKMIISLEPNVRLTSNQAVFSSLSIVSRSIKKNDQFGPWRDPGGSLSAWAPQNQPRRVHFRVHLGVHEGP